MDKDRIDRIIDLREKGMGYRAIALETGLTRDLVRYYCKSRGFGGKIKETLTDKGVLCPQCGKTIEQPARGRKRRFCSEACRRAYWHSHPEEGNKSALYHLTCACCGREFLSYGNKNRKYCSRECYTNGRFWGKSVDLSPLQSDEYQGQSIRREALNDRKHMPAVRGRA